jgi:hypothetical protein
MFGAHSACARVRTPAGCGVDLVAPRVAIPIGTPGGGYTARDGTALAAAPITALAALVLAHHDDFTQAYPQRGPERIDHLRGLLMATCRPARGSGAHRRGRPDAPPRLWHRHTAGVRGGDRCPAPAAHRPHPRRTAPTANLTRKHEDGVRHPPPLKVPDPQTVQDHRRIADQRGAADSSSIAWS